MQKNILGLAVLVLITVFPFSANADTLWQDSGLNIYNTNTGNVGIGTTAPGARIEINPNANTTKGLIIRGDNDGMENIQEWQNSVGTPLSYINASGYYVGYYKDPTNSWAFDENGYGDFAGSSTAIITWGPNGNPFGSDISLSRLSPGVLALGNGSIGSYAGILNVSAINGSTVENGVLTLQGTTNETRTTSYLNLQPNGGNVGIGITIPTEKLEVNGNIKLSGNIVSDGDICLGVCQ